MAAKCPDCDSSIEISEDITQGEILSCPCCGLELEVVKVNADNVELQELIIEGEDWGE
ncbi:lysine biosynthesis protein LysW [Candidatus Bathyarchaeota archaeon]|nr:lysine biosynthesis protein LysW [Candidatus Bathyarchaeota archaeon]